MYTSDAKFMVEHVPTASGRSAIQSCFAGMFAAMGSPGLALTRDEVSENEEMVREVGKYSLTDKSGKKFDKGKYIVLWKMEDGKWKLHRDIFNSCLLYTSDAADERSSVDLGGRRIIKKKK